MIASTLFPLRLNIHDSKMLIVTLYKPNTFWKTRYQFYHNWHWWKKSAVCAYLYFSYPLIKLTTDKIKAPISAKKVQPDTLNLLKNHSVAKIVNGNDAEAPVKVNKSRVFMQICNK